MRHEDKNALAHTRAIFILSHPRNLTKKETPEASASGVLRCPAPLATQKEEAGQCN